MNGDVMLTRVHTHIHVENFYYLQRLDIQVSLEERKESTSSSSSTYGRSCVTIMTYYTPQYIYIIYM